jgi:steroid delta-isomerase-like uncharacterized protein
LTIEKEGVFPMSETNKEVVRRLFEGFNTGNPSVIDEVVSNNFVYHEPTLGERRGRQGSKEIMTTYRTAFPDAKITINEQFADGDTVVTRWTATGTHNGVLFGIAPTGRHVTCDGILITRFQNGKVAEEYEVFDTLGMMRQIGVVSSALGKAA